MKREDLRKGQYDVVRSVADAQVWEDCFFHKWLSKIGTQGDERPFALIERLDGTMFEVHAVYFKFV